MADSGPTDLRAADLDQLDASTMDGARPDTPLTDALLSDMALPDIALSDTTLSDTAQPDTAQPDMALSDTTLSDTSLSDTTLSDTAPPDTAQPDTAQPDSARPDTAQPDTAQPDTAQPDTAQPDTAQPDAGAPDDLLCVATNCQLCEGRPCYGHPQDAVNAAVPGDTIIVHPGQYGPRYYGTTPPHWSDNDRWAPPLIVYRDGLTIRAVDPTPSNTVLYNDAIWWLNPVAIQASTGGVWVGDQYDGAGVNPVGGTAPGAVIIIADNVTVEGFRIYNVGNVGAVIIGALCSGCSQYVGVSGATLRGCDVSGHMGVSVWKTLDTGIESCVVDNTTLLQDSLGEAISVWDGSSTQPPLLSSRGTRIVDNRITSSGVCSGVACRGILIGAEQGVAVDHGGLLIDGNTIVAPGHGVFLWNSAGADKVMTCSNEITAGLNNLFMNAGSTLDGPYPSCL